MGRKIDLKKIEDVTKCQVTFSKRRSSLIKKSNEIAVCCDVDVAFVAFSPSGRISKYCNKKRIEDVIQRYVDLPPESRLTHMENVQGKMEKLKKISYIKSDTSKLHFLDNRIENLELQIKKCGLELQIVEADLRDYEVAPEQGPASLHQLSWCERNLNHSLEKVIARKMEIEKQTGLQHSSNFNENELASIKQNDEAGEIMTKLDPWISPYSAKVRESLFQDLVDQTNIATPNMNHAGPSNIYNFPLPHFSNILESGFTNMTCDAQIPLEHSMVDQLRKLPDQINADTWNNFSSQSSMVDPLRKLPDQINADTWNNFSSQSSMVDPLHKLPGQINADTWNNFSSQSSMVDPLRKLPDQINADTWNNFSFQSSMVDPLRKLPDQINADTWNNFSTVSFPDAAHMTTQTLRDFQAPNTAHMTTQTLHDFQAPRFTSTTMVTPNAGTAEIPQPLYNEVIGASSQFANLSFNQFNNMEGGETIGQLYMNFGNTLSNTNAINGYNTDVGGSSGLNTNQMQQIQTPSEYLQPEKDVFPDTMFDNLNQEALGQNMLWTPNNQGSSSWEWEDLLLTDNFQFGDSSKNLF